jgi:transposase
MRVGGLGRHHAGRVLVCHLSRRAPRTAVHRFRKTADETSQEAADADSGQPAGAQRPLVRDYVDSLQGKLQLHYLPGYAPELNPDELVWNYMKRTGTAKQPLRKGDQMQVRIEADLQAIRRNPKLVRSFFRAPSVACISDC